MRIRGIMFVLFLLFLSLTACFLKIQPAYTDIIIPEQNSSRQQTILEQVEETHSEEETTKEITITEATVVETTVHYGPIKEPETQSETVSEEPTTVYKEPELSYGTAGRLDIPSVGIGVSLYSADLYRDDTQSIVDRWDSAAIFPYRERITVIADHNNQGFSAIRNTSIGDCAVISQNNGSYACYLCTRICCNGHNLGTEIVDENGDRVEYNTDGELVMYTCNDCWQNITIVFWQRTD